MNSLGVEDADRFALFRFGRLGLWERSCGVTAYGFKTAAAPSGLRDLADDAVGHDLTQYCSVRRFPVTIRPFPQRSGPWQEPKQCWAKEPG